MTTARAWLSKGNDECFVISINHAGDVSRYDIMGLQERDTLQNSRSL